MLLVNLSKINWPLLCGLISWFSVIAHGFMCLCTCTYHTVLILWCDLKNGDMTTSVSFLFFPLLQLFCSSCSYIQIRRFFPISVENVMGILIGNELNLLYISWVMLGSLPILLLPVHSCELSFHLFISSIVLINYSLIDFDICIFHIFIEF